ncbi:armadillo-type protein [Scleroderma citrinum]
MADDTIVVPILLLDGSTQYPAIPLNATAQNLVDILTRLDVVKATALSDSPSSPWALQRVRKEKAGRRWEPAELDSLDNGIISSTTVIKSLIPTSLRDTNTSSKPSLCEEQPALRLVSLHLLLSLSLTFLRVPEVHDGFQWTVFFGVHTTAGDVVNNVVKELGLVRRMPTSKRAETIEYTLEQSMGDPIAIPLAPSARIVEVLQKTLATSPGEAPVFHFCIPECWFLRPKPRPVSMQSLSGRMGLGTETSTEREDDTAKQKKSIVESPPLSSSRPVSPEWRSSIAQNRLSSFFPSWSQPAPATTSAVIASANRKSISEPLLTEQNTGGSCSLSSGIIRGSDEEWNDTDAEELGRCLVCDTRAEIYRQSSEKKRQLILGVRQSRNLPSERASAPGSPIPTASISSRLPRLLSQFSGDSSILKRLSTFSTWSANTPTPQPSYDSKGFSGEFERSTTPQLSAPSQPQTTGGVFSSLWTILGGEPMVKADNDVSARAYVDGLRKARSLDAKCVNYLISLRVHLSTAKLEWIESFLAEDGMVAITELLSSLTAKAGKQRVLTDGEGSVLLELIRCLRVLLNTQPGFNSALITPVVTSHLVYFIFHGAPLRSRILAAELLAALCMLSLDEGHPSVLASFSEYRLAHNEVFRFQSLVAVLKVPDTQFMEQSTVVITEGDGEWEARIAFMALINAITNRPDSLEERIVLRDEFTRRGLNEILVGLRYSNPPEGLLTQLNTYLEEKFEDEEEFRDRARRAVQTIRGRSSEELELALLLESVLESAKVLESTNIVENLLRRLDQLMKRNSDPSFKLDVLSVLDNLVGHLVALEDIDDAWIVFIDHITTSIQKVTGNDVRTHYAKDIQMLRDRVDSLSRQNAALTSERLESKGAIAESLSKLASPSKASNERMAGFIQRLSQKEKEVGQLQAEIERLKRQTIRPDDNKVRTERDKTKVNSLNDEVEKLRAKTVRSPSRKGKQ